MKIQVYPMQLQPGDVMADGFTVTRPPSKADFRNTTTVWGTNADGTRGSRTFGIIHVPRNLHTIDR